MPSDSPLVSPYDIGAAPLAARPAAAFASPQGGVVQLGSDYGQTAKAQVPKVDSSGNLYTIPATASQAGTPVASANSVVGNVVLGLNALTPTAALIDALGNLSAAPIGQPTFAAISTAVSLSSGKSLLALLNKSTSSVVRIVSAYAINTATNAGVLSSYNIFAEQLQGITGYSGGSSVTPTAHDSADSLPSGITLATGATVSGEYASPYRRWITSNYPLAPGATAAEDTTMDQQGRDAWVNRGDLSTKPITVRPGTGVHIKVASSVSYGAQDVTLVFTVSNA